MSYVSCRTSSQHCWVFCMFLIVFPVGVKTCADLAEPCWCLQVQGDIYVNCDDQQLISLPDFSGFEGFGECIHLHLNNNNFSQLFASIFWHIRDKVCVLEITNNSNVLEISWNAFSYFERSLKILKLHPIHSMDLEDPTYFAELNSIENIQVKCDSRNTDDVKISGDFWPRSLRTLHLKNCGITSLEHMASVSLVELDLSQNKFTKFPLDLAEMLAHTLERLNLEDNGIDELKQGTMPHNCQLRELSLKGNKLQLIEENVFENCVFLKKLILPRIHQVGNLREFQSQKFPTSHFDFIESEPENVDKEEVNDDNVQNKPIDQYLRSSDDEINLSELYGQSDLSNSLDTKSTLTLTESEYPSPDVPSQPRSDTQGTTPSLDLTVNANQNVFAGKEFLSENRLSTEPSFWTLPHQTQKVQSKRKEDDVMPSNLPPSCQERPSYSTEPDSPLRPSTSLKTGNCTASTFHQSTDLKVEHPSRSTVFLHPQKTKTPDRRHAKPHYQQRHKAGLTTKENTTKSKYGDNWPVVYFVASLVYCLLEVFVFIELQSKSRYRRSIKYNTK